MVKKQTVFITRKEELPLDSDNSSPFLKVMISIAVFLFAVTLAGVMSINAMLVNWNESILGSLTVQIMPVNNIDKEKAAAQTPLTVLPGMELRFTAPGNINDYLVYGLTEEWLYETEELLEKSLPQFMSLARAAGLLVYQAHPFRNGMRIVDPGLLDGFEVYNACVRHASRNGIAEQWAQRHGKPGISGSDYHRREDAGRGGIETDAEIRTNDDLLLCLRSGAYRLIRK